MKELIVKNQPKSPISEAYRRIRTNIEFSNVDNEFKSILFVSATASEGKTTTISNVAMTLKDAGKKVIIVDCDLRKPRIHKFFDLSNKKGLTDILIENIDYKLYIQRHEESSLDIITSGKIPDNPSELLVSNSMKRFIEKLKENYDYILIDAPPIVPVTDGTILASFLDRVVLVCASGQVEIDMAKRAKEALDKVGANILGTVLNKVAVDSKKYSYYYYYRNEGEEK